MNNWNHTKAITIISFIAAIGGLLTILLPVFTEHDYQDGPPLWRMIGHAAFQTVYLNYFDRDLLYWWVEQGNVRVPVNVADILFHFLFLTGAITFAISGFRNVRLIGFCFAVVFFVQCGELPMIIFNIIRRFDLLKEQEQVWWTALYFASNVLWLWLSYYVLRTIRKHRSLSVEKYEADGVQQAFFNTAGKGQRIVHLLVDRIMIILLCSTWIIILAGPARYMDDDLDRSEILVLAYILCIIVYYLFFESVLGITPAKFLTATRVADEFGNKPSFGKILGRTLSRLVPFDAWSFLGSRGWHDSWSDTYVLNDSLADEDTRFSFEEKKEETVQPTDN